MLSPITTVAVETQRSLIRAFTRTRFKLRDVDVVYRLPRLDRIDWIEMQQGWRTREYVLIHVAKETLLWIYATLQMMYIAKKVILND